jgi:hypothetical protein
MLSIACFVSPHGFGHAARASAVMAALARLRPDLRFEIVSTVPDWFFAQSLDAPFALHRLPVDVGLVQRSPLEEDLAATEAQLEELTRVEALGRLVEEVASLGCRLVLCDIAPLGLAVARRLGLPGVLVENFTWDWIYRAYEEARPGLARHRKILGELFELADLRLQTEPVCEPAAGARRVAPVSRRPQSDPDELRLQLGVSRGERLVLVTMGGVRWEYRSLDALRTHPRAHFVVPGSGRHVERQGRLLRLPFRSSFYHPDLVHAADVVVGKLGYSTVAEIYHSGAASAFIARERFPESAVLARFVTAEMDAAEISEKAFNDGSWLEQIEPLLGAVRRRGRPANGADEAARAIANRLLAD